VTVVSVILIPHNPNAAGFSNIANYCHVACGCFSDFD